MLISQGMLIYRMLIARFNCIITCNLILYLLLSLVLTLNLSTS